MDFFSFAIKSYIYENQPKTMKNQPGNIKNHEKPIWNH